MTDRAVVDDPCPFCGKDRVHDIYDGDRRVRCLSCNIFWYPDDPEPEPRALVALSEDRQWLAVLDVKNVWNVMEKRYGQATHGFWWKSVQDIRDTGQDAQDVLAAFLEGRDA